MAEQSEAAAGGVGAYEELLQEQAQCLTRLKVQRGNPSLRVIEARAKKLVADEKVSLPPATQSAAFGGGYLGQDKLMWLVRALLSWDRFGRECDPPAYGGPELDEWYDRWTGIATAKQARRRRAAAPSSPDSDLQPVEGEVSLAPSVPEPTGKELAVPVLDSPDAEPHFKYRSSFDHGTAVLGAAFSPDGRLLAIADRVGLVSAVGPGHPPTYR
ncbi:hypothetical protein [Streptomyces virginiae]|uniref:hypothetical protein n=1 Tax=Streptomyces virginiae TaxID=1961 RepID=UPI0033171009